MPLEISDKELSAVTKLDAAKRYEYFIKRVADWAEAWALYNDGWVTYSDDDGRILLPLWPARRYADECRTDDWRTAEARAIDLDSLMTDVLSSLEERGQGVAVFPVVGSQLGSHPDVPRLREDLRRELQKYGE